MKYIFLLTFAAFGLMAADATGRWTGTLMVTTPDGGQESHSAYLVLKQEGAKLSGTAGPDANKQHAIENGKAEEGSLAFEVKTEDSVMKFALTQEGDQIKGEIKREREGEAQTAKLDVKREK